MWILYSKEKKRNHDNMENSEYYNPSKMGEKLKKLKEAIDY